MKRNNKLAKDIMASLPPVMVRRIETRMLVAKMLHDYLDSRGITQQALALKMGKQPSEVSKWLSGNHNLTIDTLSDIGFYLGTDFLVNRNDAPRFHCIKIMKIARPTKKTGAFETVRLSGFVSANAHEQNVKSAEQCLA